MVENLNDLQGQKWLLHANKTVKEFKRWCY